ncbi:MAG: 1-acyl-sn-glycerol-3-phosphate acyltransferase [Bdellovibrionales bacterium]|nr:1-acyl-sn-glycerol-3-phosphate acyltransferase [Bdellovibrionales bacterium]
MKRIFTFIFKLLGWEVTGGIPEDIKKAVLVAGGHTSNWDLLYSVATLYILNKDFSFLIKKEALIFPFKKFLLSLGAIPIDRDSKGQTNYVDQMAKVFEARSEAYLCLAPEGTRSATKDWKSGFYHIAKKANVPIIVCYLDYPNKKTVVGKVLTTDKSADEVMNEMKEYLKVARPKHPDRFLL